MKKLLISFAVMASLASFLVTAFGQNQTTTGSKPKPASATTAPQGDPPHKIGLIDMGRVFKEYKKFDALREDWKAELQTNEDSAKKLAGDVQKVVEEMKTYKAGSQEFIAAEKKQAQLAANFELFRKNSQRELMRKEADIYKTVYLEAMTVVERFAEHYGYTLVMRFNSENIEGEDLQKLQIGLNRVIVYHRNDDDLTDPVITHLNKQYDKSLNSAAPKGRPAPQSATKPDNGKN